MKSPLGFACQFDSATTGAKWRYYSLSLPNNAWSLNNARSLHESGGQRVAST
jgi:hypothetical protein